MKSNKLLLIIILVETFTIFCLGVLSDQIAELFKLPPYLLLGFAALGLSLTAILSYFLHKPVDTEHMAIKGLSFRDVLTRLTHRKGDSKFFSPGYSKFTQNLLLLLGLGGAVVYGIVAAFLRIPFTNSERPNLWFLTIGGFLLLSYIPIFFINRQSYSPESVPEKLFLHTVLLIGLFLIIMMGLGLGLIAIFVFNWLINFTY